MTKTLCYILLIMLFAANLEDVQTTQTLATDTKKEMASVNADIMKSLREMISTYNKGKEVPPLDEESQTEIRTELKRCSDSLNQLFPEAIAEENKELPEAIHFYTSPELALALETEDPIEQHHDSSMNALNTMIRVMGIQGMRTFDGKSVMIHTTDYRNKTKPGQISSEVATIIGRHEQTHLKVKPVVDVIDTDRTIRKTGCKKVYLEGESIMAAEHGLIYEAQTNCLSVISSDTSVGSWGEVRGKILESQRSEKVLPEEDVFAVAALTRLMDFAFPDFNEGIAVMGETYFRSDGDLFFTKVGEKLAERGNEQIMDTYKSFVEASRISNQDGLSNTVSRLVKLGN